MKKLASIVAVGTLLATAACTQTPPPQPPQPPPPQPTGAMMGCPMMMGHGQMMMEHHEEMRGEHARRPWHGREGMRGGPEGDRAVMRELAMLGVHLYPPPMLLRRAQQIGLTQDQIGKIRQEVLSAQARSVELKAKIEKAKVESMRLLAADKVDQHAVDAQIDEAAKAAAELRKLHVGVMLHVRDVLTPEQIKKLDEHKPRNPDPKQAAAADDDDDDDDEDEG
jgi:Spy/CpxP family protein refolding chaperone